MNCKVCDKPRVGTVHKIDGATVGGYTSHEVGSDSTWTCKECYEKENDND